ASTAGASVISNSYGGPEEGGDQALGNADYTHPGKVVVASSGDCGYRNEAAACPKFAKAANFPADSPAVIAVGGTSLTNAGGSWKSTAWAEGGSGCSTLFSAGLWQSSVADFAATGCGAGRAVADLAAIGDPSTGVNIYDSTPEFAGAKTGWGVWGGTSVAAPIVAAEFALAGGSHGVSYPAATVYSHSGEAGALYDVTVGSNGKCAGASVCTAVGGYDGPTGLGSPLGLEAFALAGSPKSTSAPAIAGTLEQGQTLGESHGGWTGAPSSYSYQWERCGAAGNGCLAIAGATAQSYLLGGADVGLTIRVRETAHNAAGSNGAQSAVTAPVATDVPAVEGFTPAAGITGSRVTIAGVALGSATKLVLGKLAASFVVLSPGKLEATVPAGDASGKLTVTTPHGSASAKGKYFVTFALRALKPAAGPPGTLVTLKGLGFNTGSKVSFAGTPAASTFLSSTKLKATVPGGAATGYVTVTNTSGAAGAVSSPVVFTP
ncbi:MAG: IPT/TIG domain-containing protein, partial [Solirubrobacteraceae bacterium]